MQTPTQQKRKSNRSDLWDIQVRLKKISGPRGRINNPVGTTRVGFISDDQLDDDGLPRIGNQLYIRDGKDVLMRTSVVDRVVELPDGFVIHTINGGRYEAVYLRKKLLKG